MFQSPPSRSPDTRLLNNEIILEELGRSSNPFLTEDHDVKLCDAYLQKKLTEANALLRAQGDRETNLVCTMERLNRENEDLRHQNAAMKSEIHTYKSKQVSLDQQLESETRQRFTCQERLISLEKELKDEREKFKICLERLKDTEGKMIGTDHLAKKMYSLASDSCAQTDALKGEVHSLETLIDTCKSAMTKLSEEKIDLSTKLNVVETEYENYTGTMQDALADIEILKEESVRQEAYINDTLSRFREISIHFESMKNYVTHQQIKLDSCAREMSMRAEVEASLKKELADKCTELDKLIEKMSRLDCLSSEKIRVLETTRNEAVTTFQKAEEKSRLLEESVQISKEEILTLEGKVDSLQSLLEGENQRCVEMKNLFDEEKSQREESHKQLRHTTEKIHALEMKLSEVNGAKSKCEEINAALESEKARLADTIRSLENEANSMRDTNSVLKGSLTQVELRMQSLRDEFVNLEGNLKEQFAENSKLVELHSRLSKETESKHAEIQEKDKKLDSVVKACKEQEEKRIALEEELAKSDVSFRENEKKLNESAERIELLKQANRKKEEMNEKIYKQLNETNQLLDTTESEKRLSEERLRDMREDFERYKLQSDNDRTRMHDETKRIRLAVQCEEESKEKVKKAQEEAIFVLNEKMKTMADMVDTDREQIVKYQDRLSFLSSKNEELLQVISKLEEANSKKKETIQSIEVEKAKLDEELKKRQEELNEIKREMKESNQEFEKFKQEVTTFEKLWTKQQTQALKELQDELTSPLK